MIDYNDIYIKNKELDNIYINKYSNNIDNYYEKNCLELIVELCELANESKCFKYWSIKKVDYDKLLEEYADCILMVLCIYNTFDIDSLDILDIDDDRDIVIIFNDVIRMCTLLQNKDNVDDILLKNIFSYLIYIGKLLKLDDKLIREACYKKIDINKERLNSNYQGEC